MGLGLDLLANTSRDESTSEIGILRPNSLDIESAVAIEVNVVAAEVVVVVRTVGSAESESFDVGRSLEPRSSW